MLVGNLNVCGPPHTFTKTHLSALDLGSTFKSMTARLN